MATLCLSGEYDIEGVITVYTWYDEDGNKLTPATAENGVFTLGEDLVDKQVYCRLTNSLYPDLILSTTTMLVQYSETLGTPVLEAHSVGYTSAKLTWTPVEGATGYEIYRCDRAGQPYSLITSVDGSVNTYTNIGLSTGTTYYYKVRAYVTAGTDKLFGNYSACATARPVPATPVVKVTAVASGSVELNWVKIYGATGYSVYRSTEKDGTYTFVKNLPEGDFTTYIDKNVTSGQTYYYKVRAYRQMGSDMMFGLYSVPVSAKPE